MMFFIVVDGDCERCRDDVNPKCTIMLAISYYRAISADVLRQTAPAVTFPTVSRAK